MNTATQFTSNFWNIYIAVIVVLSFIGLAWLLLSQNVVKRPKKGEDRPSMGRYRRIQQPVATLVVLAVCLHLVVRYRLPGHVSGFGRL